MPGFDITCQRCPRIARNLAEIRRAYPDYHARPVPPFGDTSPSLLVVGLGPGKHGANATGRPFTGDYAGILLYRTLHRYGFSNQPDSVRSNDNLRLIDCRITNAVKCLPPDNKPTTEEVKTCNSYLADELDALEGPLVIMGLGRVAHDAVLRALGLKQKDYPFGHAALHPLSAEKWLVDSYHCSRYNTQTRRLTEKMFHEVFDKIHEILSITS
jgi:uracil-DNA glycosylase family 4